MTVSVAELLEEAAARSGPWDGDLPFAANLELLVESCRRTAALNATGIQVLGKTLVRHLRNLRDVQAYVGAHPEVAGRRFQAPVVVTGLPRTGTTLLHNLLALDPAHRVLRVWEALRPVPPAEGGPSPDERQAQAALWLESFHRLVPGFRAIHAGTPTGPEECDALLQNTFASQHFDDMFDAAEYSEWLGEAPLTQEYEHYAVQLRILSTWSWPAGAAWALKSPGHLGHLDALLAALPGSTVVLCHRHPREAVASWASLVHTLRRAYSDAATPATAGRHALGRAATAMSRALEGRAAAGEHRFVDVSYAGLVRAPVEAVKAVYASLGRDLDPSVEEAMQRWALANPQHSHGPHRYDLARFGLREEDVDAAFGAYLARFGDVAVAAAG